MRLYLPSWTRETARVLAQLKQATQAEAEAEAEARENIPVGVGGAVGRAKGAVRPAEAAVALAPGPPVLAGDAIEEHLPVARALDGGHRLGLPGRLQRPGEPAAAATVVVTEQQRRREDEVVREEDGVEEQR